LLVAVESGSGLRGEVMWGGTDAWGSRLNRSCQKRQWHQHAKRIDLCWWKRMSTRCDEVLTCCWYQVIVM